MSIPEMSDQRRLKGKVVLVTGAGSGIGRATSHLLARHGALLVCGDLDLPGATTTVMDIRHDGGVGSEVKLDVTAESDWEQAMAVTLERHSRLDALVNCAGISFAASTTETSYEDWRRVLAVNLDGVFLGTKHALTVLRQSGSGGSIVNVSSASGLKAPAGAAAYSASKAAVCMFTKSVAKECVERGDAIRVNTVCPSGVKTPMWRTMQFFREMVERLGSEDAAYQAMAQTLLHRRFAEASEIAEAILFLVSDESKYMTGHDLVIDGGYTL